MNLHDILTEEALGLLAERLMTPLQIEHYLTLALEQAYRLGEKPVTAEMVEATLAPDINHYQLEVGSLAMLARIRLSS